MNRIRVRCLFGLAAALVVAAGAAGPALAVGTPAGTTISNQATVNFQDVNGNPLTQLSNLVQTTVSQVAGVTVDPDGASNADPGDVVYYAHVVTNGGNGPDTIDLTVSSSQGWSVTIYRDVNNNGTYEAGTDVVLTDSDGDLVPDSGVLAADGFMRILVAVTVPAGTANGTVDSTTVTGTSSFNTAVSDLATDTTTVDAPSLSVVKSVAPVGDQPPGTVLTYTIVITNNGSGAANAVVLRDPVPANTTYVSGSIVQDAVSKTDAADADNADHDATNPGEVTVNVGSLAAGGGSTTISFQTQID